MTDEQRKVVESLIEELAFEKEQLLDLRALIEEKTSSKHRRIQKMRRLQDLLDVRIKELMLQISDECPEEARDIAVSQKKIEVLISQIRDYMHNLPIANQLKGLSIEHANIKVTSSSVRVAVYYKTKELLYEHPELEEVQIDGDPICKVTVDPEVLERAIDSKIVNIPDIDKYRMESKVRNPSVHIQFLLEES